MKSKINEVDYKAKTDMTLGIPQPQFQKELPKEAMIIDLPIVNHDTAIKAGASGGKISGAGGGGFMVFYCPGLNKYAVTRAISKYGGEFRRVSFNQQGVEKWTID